MHWDHEPGWRAEPCATDQIFAFVRVYSRSGSWKAPMTLRPCTGTMNPAGGRSHAPRTKYSRPFASIRGPVHGKPPFVLRMHWDHEPGRTAEQCAALQLFASVRVNSRS